MKRIWIFLGIILVLLAVGILYSKGIIKTDWQFLSMILAALAGPYTLVRNYMKRGNKKVDKIMARQSEVEKEEVLIRQRYEQLLKEREQRIAELEAQVASLEDQIDKLKLEKQQIEEKVNNLSLEEKQDEFSDFFGS